MIKGKIFGKVFWLILLVFVASYFKFAREDRKKVATNAVNEEIRQLDRIIQEWEAVLVVARNSSPSVTKIFSDQLDQMRQLSQLSALSNRGVLMLNASDQLTYFKMMSFHSDDDSICARQSMNRLTADEKRQLLINLSKQLSPQDRSILHDIRVKAVVAAAEDRPWLAVSDDLNRHALQTLAEFPEVKYKASLEDSELSHEKEVKLCRANKSYTQRILEQNEPLRSALISHHTALTYNISDYPN